MCFIVVDITRRRQEVLNKSCILFYIFCPFRLSHLHDKRKITYKSSFSLNVAFSYSTYIFFSYIQLLFSEMKSVETLF